MDQSEFPANLFLIGQNVQHSLSPLIHNYAAHKFGFKFSYKAQSILENELLNYIVKAWESGVQGINITAPYKEILAKKMKSPYPSINTLYRGDKGWLTASTDGTGFAKSLDLLKAPLESFEHLVFIGGGGVVSGLLWFLNSHKKYKHLSITIMVRRKESFLHLQKARGAFSLAYEQLSAQSKFPKSDKTLLIQATSGPQQNDTLESLCPLLKKFKGCFVDLNYGKNTSYLYGEAQRLGIPSLDGLPMLIEQALACQKLWWGTKSDFESTHTYILQKLNYRKDQTSYD